MMRKQEKTRLADIAAEKVHFEAIQAHADIVSLLTTHEACQLEDQLRW